MKKYTIASLVLSMIFILATGCKFFESPKDKTIKNLKAAVAGEMTASTKYAAFARKAKDEGLLQIAALFQATSRAESIHAARDIEVLNTFREQLDPVRPEYKVKSTKENLQDAIAGESHEIDVMYPDFLKTADEAKVTEAATSFTYAFETEKKHLAIYKDALEKLEKNDVNKIDAEYSICPKCGNTFSKKGPEICDICGEAQASFIVVK